MRFTVVLALAMAGLTMTAAAQKTQKTKPSHDIEKDSKKGSHVVVKDSAKSSTSQELRRVEQSGSKVAGSRRAESAKANRAPVLKAEKKESNPPIHFGSSGGGKGGKGKAGDPYKGRLRHKGSRH